MFAAANTASFTKDKVDFILSVLFNFSELSRACLKLIWASWRLEKEINEDRLKHGKSPLCEVKNEEVKKRKK